MNPTTLILISRKLLQVAEAETESASKTRSPPAAVAGDLNFQSINGSSSADAAMRRSFTSSTTFDSSMALTVLVLLTALVFMGFFSVYIRCFTVANDPSAASASRRRPAAGDKKGGLDPAAVNSLPLVAYGMAGKHPMIDDCPICLSEFQERETVKLIPYCSHVFHPSCIDTWLTSHVTCPLCRSAQLFKRAEEVVLDVTKEKKGFHRREIGVGSTVANADTWSDEGSSEVTRTGSSSDLADQAALQRSTSF